MDASGALAAGASRRKKTPQVIRALEQLLERDTAGDPLTGLRWMRKTTVNVASQLGNFDVHVRPPTVARWLRQLKFSWPVNQKRLGARHPERDRQFHRIAKLRRQFVPQGEPRSSVDAKQRELVGNFKNAGAQWEREPTRVNDHDFRTLASGVAVLSRRQGSGCLS